MLNDIPMIRKFTKYSFIFFLIFYIQESFGQQFNNLNYHQICDSSKTGLCYWDLSWGGKGSVGPAIIHNKKCMVITGKVENAVGFAEQSAQYDTSNGISIITVSALIKTDSVIGKGAGLNIGLYDDSGNLVSTKDMGGFYSLDWIRGTKDWKKYSISIVSSPAVVKIKIGAILYGKGKAYYKDYNVKITPIKSRRPSKLAIEYISAACDTISLNSLVRDSINISQLKRTALLIAGDAKSYPDCYLAIDYLLESLRPYGDEHSFFMTAKEVKNWETEGSQISAIQYSTFKIIDSCGYVFVPPFHGGNQLQILHFADSLQSGIDALSKSNIKGWIVDLRQNTGGNMAPMIAGLGPLFSNPKLGSLVDVNGEPNNWYYKNGKYFWDKDTGWSVTKPVVLSKKLPIAVLTGNQTGSSGEAVVVSFIGNDMTKLFGQPTWGLTTGNGNFELIDGSQIFLASTVFADRNDNQYSGSIIPDFIIENSLTSDDVDTVIAAAVKWIKTGH